MNLSLLLFSQKVTDGAIQPMVSFAGNQPIFLKHMYIFSGIA